jgi:Cu/Ag efflux pump CusA
LSAASAQHQHQQGPDAITRESAERMQLVMANVSGRDLGAVVADIEQVLDEIVLPQGAHIELSGQFESAASATRTLLALGFIVLVGMFLLLRQAFRSSNDAVLVMINLPLAFAMGEPGSEIQAPMAIVILCGLTSSTVLNMLVVAAIYLKVTRDGWGIASLCARWQRYRSGTALDSQADAAAA